MRFFLVLIIIIILFIAYTLNLHHILNIEYLKTNLDYVREVQSAHQILFILIFFGIYVLVAALSFPGATVLTLASGALFGFILGTIIVSFASSIGATCAFLISRYVLRDFVQSKFAKTMESINSGMEKEGAFYLFSLRLIPIFPFFLINLVMGLTKIPIWTFYWVSQIGMLLGTFVYVNAGVELSKIESLSDVLSLKLILALTSIGLLPLLSKKVVDILRYQKVYTRYKHLKPKSYDYDMVVIGSGSAGLVTTYLCAILKSKVALIEQSKMGGDCLNTGCVPSKALIKSAYIVHLSKICKDFGIKKMDTEFVFADVMKRVHDVIKKVAPHDSTERYTNLGVNCITGKAKITSPWTVEVNGNILTTRNITIACGAAPFVPPIPGLDTIDYLTSDNIWNLTESPKRLLILGGGPIGCELAQCFCRLGAQVTIVEMIDRIMAIEDQDVSNAITNQFQKEGIVVLTNHKAIEFKKKDSEIILICESSGKQKEIAYDQVLVAVGRRARTQGYGLEELGINLRKNGTIDVNEYLQTKYPNIFACGDIVGPFQFTHTAAYQAWFCAINGLFRRFKKFKMDYRVIPWCTFTDPEVATVGLSEQSAKQKGISYELTKYHLNDLDRAIADNTEVGFIKVLTEPGKDKILGATIVGAQASNVILEFISAMKYGIGLNKILGTIHIYPTMGEANKNVAGYWRQAHTYPRVLNFLEHYFKWKRS